MSFGDFELDEVRFELRRAGVRVHVQPKVLRLLFYLVQQRERAVSSEELMRALWPDTTVGAGSLKRAVLGARQALADGGRACASIRTVHGHGYRFVSSPDAAAVAPEGAATTADAAENRAGTGAARRASEQPLHAVEDGRPVRSSPFVGREPLMKELTGLVEQAARGATCCLLLTGGPGIGKTRTLAELCTYARQQGGHVWLGRCTDAEGEPFLWPFTQVLRAALASLGAARMRELMGPGVAEIGEAIPELRHALADLPAAVPLTSSAARFRLFDSVAMFLRRASERTLIVLGFDDLQHADEATLALLLFITRQPTSSALMITGTFRSALPGAQRWPAGLDALLREDRTRCIELSGFTREALARYVELSLERAPSALAIDALHEQTAGNPLFVHQILESWRARADAAPFELAEVTNSIDLRASIERHLEVVSPSCCELLRVASVLGRDFSLGLLAQVAEQPVDRTWQQLVTAEATSLIEGGSPDVGHFRFTHPLIRDALYRSLSARDRARLHGRAGRMLEAQGVGPSELRLAEVARHLVLAAPAYDEGLALPFTLRAAEVALERRAYEEAAAHFQRALALLDLSAPDPRRRVALLFRRGDALTRTTELATARSVLFEAASLARELGDADTLCQAAALLAVRPEPGEVDAAQLAILQDAIAVLSCADERRVLLLAALAKSLAYDKDRVRRVQLAREALHASRTLTQHGLRMEVLKHCQQALIGPDHLPERAAIARDLKALAEGDNDAAAALHAASAQVDTRLESGDMAGLDAAIEAMESLAERVREPFCRWRLKAVRSTRALIRGEMAEAEHWVKAAYEYGAPLDRELARHAFCAQMMALHMMQGRLTEAEPLAREMAERYPDLPGWRARLGAIDWALGRRDRARRALAALLERGLGWICSEPAVLTSLCSIADLCCAVRDAQAAALVYGALTPYRDHIALTHVGATSYGPVARYLALLAACRGEVAQADADFARALERAEAMQSPTYVAMIGTAHAAELLRSGDGAKRERARALLIRSRALAEPLPLVAVSDACERLASHYQLVTRPATTTGRS